MYKELLNTAIEVEGLIRILIDGAPSPESVALLKEKSDSLAAECKKIILPAAEREAVASVPTPDPYEVEKVSSVAAEEKAVADVKADDDIFLSLDDEPLPSSEAPESRDKEMQTALKSLFSLNDRFLFSRELFGGDMKMFDSTLNFIEGIERFSDIEDYFYSELEWNPEDPNVAAYLDILRPHFKE